MAADSSVELQVNAEEEAQRVEEIRQIQEALEQAEKAFEPRPWGTCGKNVWCYYLICCGDRGGAKEWEDPKCCDVEHLGMHIFVIAFIGSIGLFISGVSSNGDNGNSCFSDLAACPAVTIYFVVIGVGIAIVIWLFVQLGRIIKDRFIAAEYMDTNIKLTIQSENLDQEIQTAIIVEDKLKATHKVTEDTTNALRQKFLELKQWTDQSNIVSDENSRIGALLFDKMMKLENDLKDELIESEMAIVESIYNSMHLRDGEAGLDENEFINFVSKLPHGYQKRFKFELGAFAEYAGSDGIFDRSELFVFLNVAVQEEAVKSNEERI